MAFWIPKRRRYIAVFALLAAIAPFPGAFLIVDIHTRQQAHAQLHQAAEGLLEQAELAIGDGLATLRKLSDLDIRECRAAQVAAMMEAIYADYWIMESGLHASDGQISCNHIGKTMRVSYISDPLPMAEGVTLQAVELGDGAYPGLMLVMERSGSPNLSVVLPSALATASSPGIEGGVETLRLTDGTLIAGPRTIDAGPRSPPGMVTASATGALPIEVDFSAPLDVFRRQNSWLFGGLLVGGGFISVTVLGLAYSAVNGPSAGINRLRDATVQEEFVPYYQPVVNLGTGRLTGCEVLMRWVREDGKVVPPGEFIHLAETTGLAVPMTRSLMRKVAADLGPVCAERPWLSVGINLFHTHFDDARTTEDIRQAFGKSEIAFGQLVLELTERHPVGDFSRANEQIARLHALGARVALDDTGTGAGSLAYLQHLDVDIVKIDKLFVDTLDGPGAASPIVESLIRLGHGFGMEVMAEGVETERQMKRLVEMGADEAQGYLFAPPMPAAAFLDLVEATCPAGDASRSLPLVRRDRAERMAV